MTKKKKFISHSSTAPNAKGALTEVEFEEAFSTYYLPVRNFLYYKTSRADLSEDIAQETFLKLWETRENIDRRSLKSYLFTIANNIAINRLKRNQLRFKFRKIQTSSYEVKDPQYLMEMREFDKKLQQVLSKIPDGAREVFLMNRIDGLKYREIAEMLSLSMKAVEKRMSKALAILRKEIDHKV